MLRHTLLLSCLAGALPAHAYCVHNQLPDREVRVEQQMQVERLREDRTFRHTLKPGQRQCCFNLDCNPGGRPESAVTLSVRIPGEPEYLCGAPEGSATIKVAGNGTVRIVPNSRPKSAFPYAIRIRSNDREVFGPRGLQCLEYKPKGTR
jgi:hypothetical protein